MLLFIALALLCPAVYSSPLQPRFPDGRIVGGKKVAIADFPYQLTFQQFNRHTCGATLISSKWAVTAGHCVGGGAVDFYRVGAGSSHRYNGTFYQLKSIIRHPDFDIAAIDYDIALLEIKGKVKFSETVKPANIALKEVTPGRQVNISGWGSVRQGGLSSDDLMKVTVPIVERKLCENAYKDLNAITARMICAGHFSTGGKDACQGDSGGPLVSDNTLYGVVSWGYGCAQPNFPGVYTNVAELSSWIKSVTSL